MKSRRGFTLIELMCVLFLIGLISTWFLPKITYFRTLEVNAFGRELYQDILEVKMLNITDDYIKMRIDTDYYQIASSFGEKIKRKQIDDRFVIVDNIGAHSGIIIISFNQYGHPNYAGTMYIYDRKREAICCISIMPYTGKISFYRENSIEKSQIIYIKEKISDDLK